MSVFRPAKGSSTTELKRHMSIAHDPKNKPPTQQRTLQISRGQPSVITKQYACRLLLSWLGETGLPFNLVSHRIFRKMLSPDFLRVLPSAQNLSQQLSVTFRQVKEVVKGKLQVMSLIIFINIVGEWRMLPSGNGHVECRKWAPVSRTHLLLQDRHHSQPYHSLTTAVSFYMSIHTNTLDFLTDTRGSTWPTVLRPLSPSSVSEIVFGDSHPIMPRTTSRWSTTLH